MSEPGEYDSRNDYPRLFRGQSMLCLTPTYWILPFLFVAGSAGGPTETTVGLQEQEFRQFTSRQERGKGRVRFATFNVAMNRKKSGALLEELKTGKSKQAANIAEIIQRTNADVILLNELDQAEQTLPVFLERYVHPALEKKRPSDCDSNSTAGRTKPNRYLYSWTAPVNTGVATGIDLDADGKDDGPGDAFGYGEFPGQYSMAVISRFPIEKDSVRTFQKFLWKDMPDPQWPVDPKSKASYYSDQAKEILRLSSKSHWDIPIKVDHKTIHFLVSHPTPPVFDGPEDRNGRRNSDEIRFWADYVTGKKYFYDDQSRTGGLKPKSFFVIAGDLNADPIDGDSRGHPVKLLLEHELINGNIVPTSKGAGAAAKASGRENLKHKGRSSADTADFNDWASGNLRVDYVLPSKNLKVVDQGVFWPIGKTEWAKRLNQSSDHHLVWIDLER